VPILLNFTSATLCWFNVRTGEDGIDSMNSQSFHVIGEERKTGRMVFGPDTEQPAAVPIPSAPGSLTSARAPAPASPSPSSSTTVVLPAKGTDDSSSDSGNDGSGGSPPNSSPMATDNTSSSSGGGDGEELGAGGREESGGLSSTATAGIGVGATIGVFAVAGGVFMLWRRRRQQRSQEKAAAAAAASAAGGGMAGGDNGWPHSSFGGYYGELSSASKSAGSSAGPGSHFADWPAAQKWELDAQRGAVEAADGPPRHEMPA
jgi:hypothetical protein